MKLFEDGGPQVTSLWRGQDTPGFTSAWRRQGTHGGVVIMKQGEDAFSKAANSRLVPKLI